MGRYNVVILGGGRSPIDHNLPKGNTPFNGISLAGKVYEAVTNGYDFNRIALVMNPDERINLRKQDLFVEPTFCKGAWLSGYKGIKSIDDDLSDYFLVAGDFPFLEEKIVKAFIQKIEEDTANDILIPLVPKELNEKRFPNRRRTYQPFQEGEFLAGNIGYLSQNALKQNEYLVKKIASSYQQKLSFIFRMIVGLGLNSVLRSNHPKLPLIKYLPAYRKLFPIFSIKELEEIFSKFTGVNVRFVEFPFPESAFDIDNLKQLKSAEELYKSKIGSLGSILDPARATSN